MARSQLLFICLWELPAERAAESTMPLLNWFLSSVKRTGNAINREWSCYKMFRYLYIFSLLVIVTRIWLLIKVGFCSCFVSLHYLKIAIEREGHLPVHTTDSFTISWMLAWGSAAESSCPEFRDYHQNFHQSGLTPKSADLGDAVLPGESGCQAKSWRLHSDGASAAFLRGKAVCWYCALRQLCRKSKRCGKHIRVAVWRAEPHVTRCLLAGLVSKGGPQADLQPAAQHEHRHLRAGFGVADRVAVSGGT